MSSRQKATSRDLVLAGRRRRRQLARAILALLAAAIVYGSYSGIIPRHDAWEQQGREIR